MRKVYSVLFVQILASAAIGIVMGLDSVKGYVAQNAWIVITSMFSSLITMGLVYWKRHSHPLNLILLSAFTAFEAITVGFVASQYSGTVVLQALLITATVFLGLTLFTFQVSLIPFRVLS